MSGHARHGQAEYHRFLTEGTRTGKLATTRSDGIAELPEDPQLLLEWVTRIAGRYLGPGRAEEYDRRNPMPGELLVCITPNHVVAQVNIAD